jgi:predicted helicase
MATFADFLDKLDARQQIRGRQFEQTCKWFLENAPEYRGIVRKVWRWDEWPLTWGRDAGIVSIAETVAGDLWGPYRRSATTPTTGSQGRPRFIPE